MHIKQRLILLSTILFLGIIGKINASDLVITGVIDGPLSGGVPKAVELYVINNIQNLNIYGLGSANNGGGTDGEEFSFPSISAAAGSFLYVSSESDGFTDFFGFSPRYVNGAMSINGDDAIELFKDGNVIDIFGDINVDGTGESWEHLDGWAYRKDNTGPDGTTFVLANWSFSGINALDGETTNASASTPFPIGTYEFESNSTAPTITNITQTPSDVTSSSTVSISVEVTDNGSVEKVELLWGTTTETYTDTINMSTSDSIYTTDKDILSQAHGVTVYYKIEATDNDAEVSTSVEYSYTIEDYDFEPSKHVLNFVATKVGSNKIILSWNEDNGSVVPAGYLIKASTNDNITNPIDGIPITDNLTIGDNSGAINIPNNRISYEWSDLTSATTYYFKIYPYTNSGNTIDYKTSSTVPNDNNTTTDPDLLTSYYSETTGLTGDPLKAKLNDIIDNHITYPYTDSDIDVWDILKVTDKDTLNPNNVLLIYKGNSIDAAQEYNNANGWTREHVWAKSHGDFGTEQGPGTDTHHLRPCDNSVNTSKSNLDFDNGGTQHSEATECFYDSDSWEVRDAVKGDIARMMFYMDTRYEGENGELNLELVDYIPSSPNKQPSHGKLSTLIEWHIKDPVDNYERKRNEIIYSFQGNRNPFIDHPEFALSIWGDDPNAIVEMPENHSITTFKLGSAYPNPFNPSTTIIYDIPEYCNIHLNIYNIQGQLVKTLVNESKNSGSYKVIWNGIDNNNMKVGNGIYFYHLSSNTGFSKTSKVVFLK